MGHGRAPRLRTPDTAHYARNRPAPSIVAALAVPAALLWTALAASQAPPPPDHGPPPAPGLFLPFGLNLGAARADAGWGFILGGESSLAWLFGTAWTGAWVDGLYDFGVSTARLGAGLELGWFVFGLEAGWVGALDDGLQSGSRLGILLTSGLSTGYLRWVRLWTADEDVLELGLLLKWPLRLQHDR